jgi:hypothetical protein
VIVNAVERAAVAGVMTPAAGASGSVEGRDQWLTGVRMSHQSPLVEEVVTSQPLVQERVTRKSLM